jgi:hypothetical protein
MEAAVTSIHFALDELMITAFQEAFGYDIISWEIDFDGVNIAVEAVGTPCSGVGASWGAHELTKVMTLGDYLAPRVQAFLNMIQLTDFRPGRLNIKPESGADFRLIVTGSRRP